MFRTDANGLSEARLIVDPRAEDQPSDQQQNDRT